MRGHQSGGGHWRHMARTRPMSCRLRMGLILFCVIVAACRGETAALDVASSNKAWVSQSDIDFYLLRPMTEHWYGVYVTGKKAGYARSWTAVGGDFIETGVELRLEMTGAHAPAGAGKLVMRETRRYAKESPYGLKESSLTQTGGLVDDARSLREEDGGWFVRRKIGDAEESRKAVAGSRETLMSHLSSAPPELSALATGARVEVPMFNWQFERDETVTVKAVRVRDSRRSGIITKVATLSLSYAESGLETLSEVASGSVVLEMALGEGLRLKLEEGHVARSQIAGLNVTETGVAVSARLGWAKNIRELRLKVTVPDGATLPSAANQRVERGEGGVLMVTCTSGVGDPLAPEEARTMIQPDDIIDSNHAAIMAQANKLTATIDTPRDKVRALLKWVNQHIKKYLITHLPTASSVLDKGVGDCTEHAWLFTALARASGIPARSVYGLAYVGDALGAFGYHAWAEVALDGRWESVDPLWDEWPVDATHVKLSDSPYEVALFLGGMEIEVVGDPRRRKMDNPPQP